MPNTSMKKLLEFLRNESRSQDSMNSNSSSTAVRVPLELDGALWSAEVESADDDHLSLIVDEEAIQTATNLGEAAIRFQPDCGRTLTATGRVTSNNPLPSNQVRLNFELR